MAIQCNEITQVVNELLIAFQDCNKIKYSDLRKLVELVSAVSTCSNGGPDYGNQESVAYNTPQVVSYPVNSFHSYSLMVLGGSIIYQGFTFQAGTVKNVEFTTLNQTPLEFTVNPGSEVLFEYLTESI